MASRSRHLVDPELAPFVDSLPSFDINMATLSDFRRAIDDLPQLIAPSAENVTVAQDMVPGRDGAPDIRVLVYRPEGVAGSLPLLFHIHGGGYVSGSPEDQIPRNRYFAQDIGCLVISVAYRRPPEAAFPGPLEDCYTALLWAFHNAEALRIDPSRIAVGGQSAGGGLAAALCLLARDRKEVPVSFQFLVYPMLDDRTGAANEVDPQVYAGEFCWTAANNHFCWAAMLGVEPGGPDVSPYAAPARALNLSGLPPTFITVGALDLFVDEDIEYARRLVRAGVPTELHVYPGGFHGLEMIPDTDIGMRFTRDYHEALRRAFFPPWSA